jgi:hypothetical protein
VLPLAVIFVLINSVIARSGRCQAVFERERNILKVYGIATAAHRRGFWPGSVKGSEPTRIISFEDITAVGISRTGVRFKRMDGRKPRRSVFETHLLVGGRRPYDYVLSQDENKDRTYAVAIKIAEFLNVQIVDDEESYRQISEDVAAEAPAAEAEEKRPVRSLYGRSKVPAMRALKRAKHRIIIQHRRALPVTVAFFLFYATAIALLILDASSPWAIFPDRSRVARHISRLIAILMIVGPPVYVGYLFYALKAVALFQGRKRMVFSYRYLLFDIPWMWPSSAAERIIPFKDIKAVRTTERHLLLIMNDNHDADYIVSTDRNRERTRKLAYAIAQCLGIGFIEQAGQREGE